MTAPPERAASQPSPDAAPPVSWGCLLQLRLTARVVECDRRVRLVGDGVGVEIADDGALKVCVHNEPVVLGWDHVVDQPAAHAERLLRRWQVLTHPVAVELLMVRGGDGAPRAGRQVRLTGLDGAVLRWHEPSAVDAARPAGHTPGGQGAADAPTA